MTPYTVPFQQTAAHVSNDKDEISVYGYSDMRVHAHLVFV